MARILFLLMVSAALTGCATRFGELPDGRQYKDYDVKFNKDKGRFEVLLQTQEEQGSVVTKKE